MSNLSVISINKIETDVMSVLYANINKKFTQYTLFNKLLEDKYDSDHTIFIHPDFTSKFLLVIRTQISKYDNIIVEKKDRVYYIVCLSSKEDINKISIYHAEYIPNPIINEMYDMTYMFDYICDNDLDEYMNWTDPFDGNSIFHELILYNNIKQTTKLIEKNRFNFEIKNNQNQTPIDLINSQEMKNLFFAEFVKKIKLLTEKYNQEKVNVNTLVANLNKKVDYYESDEYVKKIIRDTSFYDFRMVKINKYHWPIKMYLFSFIVCCLAMRIIIYFQYY